MKITKANIIKALNTAGFRTNPLVGSGPVIGVMTSTSLGKKMVTIGCPISSVSSYKEMMNVRHHAQEAVLAAFPNIKIEKDVLVEK